MVEKGAREVTDVHVTFYSLLGVSKYNLFLYGRDELKRRLSTPFWEFQLVMYVHESPSCNKSTFYSLLGVSPHIYIWNRVIQRLYRAFYSLLGVSAYPYP